MALSVDPAAPCAFTLSLRIPAWSAETSVSVNGEPVADVLPGTFLDIDRQWNPGDRVEIGFDMRGRLLTRDGYQAICRGPVVLARDSRFGDGFVDETSVVQHDKEHYVELKPAADKPAGVWLAFTAPLVLGSDLEGEDRTPREVKFCDFASAGNNWDKAVRYKVWLPRTLNVMRGAYRQY